MSRSIAALGFLLLFLVSTWAWSEQPAGVPVAKPIKDSARALREKLTRPVTFEKGLDPGTKFKDAVDLIADRFDMTIAVDYAAFRAMNPGESIDEQEVRLPRVIGARLSTVLRKLTEQVGGSYLVQSDHVLITSPLRSQPAKWKDDQRQWALRVDAQFDQLPLKEALQDLADQSGLSVVLDPTLDADKRPVSITLSNVPVDTAVRVLADMVDGKMVVLDNVLYVTTFEKAGHLKAHQEGQVEQEREIFPVSPKEKKDDAAKPAPKRQERPK
jgi:hypothetical protein